MDIVLSLMLLKPFLYVRCFLQSSSIKLDSLFGVSFHPMNAETQCTKQDNLQQNTGVGSGVMCWLCFYYGLGISINLVTNTDDLLLHLLYMRL